MNQTDIKPEEGDINTDKMTRKDIKLISFFKKRKYLFVIIFLILILLGGLVIINELTPKYTSITNENNSDVVSYNSKLISDEVLSRFSTLSYPVSYAKINILSLGNKLYVRKIQFTDSCRIDFIQDDQIVKSYDNYYISKANNQTTRSAFGESLISDFDSGYFDSLFLSFPNNLCNQKEFNPDYTDEISYPEITFSGADKAKMALGFGGTGVEYSLENYPIGVYIFVVKGQDLYLFMRDIKAKDILSSEDDAVVKQCISNPVNDAESCTRKTINSSNYAMNQALKIVDDIKETFKDIEL